MSILATAYAEVTVTNTTKPVAPVLVEVTDTGGPVIEVTVTGAAAVAAASRFQRLGVRAEYDRGDGVMVPFPDREIGNELTIDESVDSYGDRLTIELIGERFSPFSGRELLGTKRRMNFYFMLGPPLAEYEALVFSGFSVEAPHDIFPPSSRVTLLDAAALYRDKRAKNWSLPPNSGRTVLSVATELLTLAGIPIGTINLPNGHGGLLRKPRALGDRTILEFLRDLLGSRGSEIGFERGHFVARRYDPTNEPVLELTPENICLPAGISSPTTLAPNVTGVVSVSFTRTEPSGLRTVVTSVTTVGPYSVKSKNGPHPPKVQKISEIITKTSYYGSLDQFTEVTERGWYAVRAAGEQIQNVEEGEPGEWEIVPYPDTNYKAYAYPDGSTRRDSQEIFRRLRKTIRKKTLDADRNVIGIREERYFFHFIERHLWRNVGGIDTLQTLTSIPINDEGRGVDLGSEVMGLLQNDLGNTDESGATATRFFMQPAELIETAIALNADGTIASEQVTTHYYSTGEEMRRNADAFGYGVDNRFWTNRPATAYNTALDPWGGLRIVTTRYRAIDEDRYEVTRVTTDGTEDPTTEHSTVTGALPRPERAEATTSSQEIRATVTDGVRAALVGELIENIEHNEFIETPEDAAILATYRARLAAAKTLTCTIGIEGQVHKWRLVRVNIPGASINGLKFYVRAVQRNAATCTETIMADYYPPHIG